jgi:ribosomal subunit interface protein
MQTQITARGFDTSDTLREHVLSSLTKLDRYYNGIQDARVTLTDSEGGSHQKKAEVALHLRQQVLTVSSTGKRHEDAVADCVRQLKRQVIRHKDKVRSVKQDRHR